MKQARLLPINYNVRSADSVSEVLITPKTGSVGLASDPPGVTTSPPASGSQPDAPPKPTEVPPQDFPRISTSRAVALASLRPVSALLDDPLREVTRKERRSLLGISVIAILVGWTGLVPEKIENLGITFAATERKALLWVSIWVVIYYFTAFLIYAWSDYLNHRNKVHEARLALRKEQEDARLGIARRGKSDDQWRLVAQVVPISWARIIFDFFVTGLVALFAIWSLWGAVHQVAPKGSGGPRTEPQDAVSLLLAALPFAPRFDTQDVDRITCKSLIC
jgi:hypothetical protein